MVSYLYVFVGGGIGSIFRYGIARWMSPLATTFPYATLTANIISCIILGALTGLSLKSGIAHNYKLLLMTGFCGGFSTFSTFSSQTYQLLTAGYHLAALVNIAASVVICLIAIYIGLKLVGF